MDENILDAVSGDAIARDWELPELPSGKLVGPRVSCITIPNKVQQLVGEHELRNLT